jgi:hypothetical protein
MRKHIITTLLIVLSYSAFSQNADSTLVNKTRVKTIAAGGTFLYASSIIILSEAWYKEQGLSTFHFFNDNSEWNQVDKMGHIYTAYHISRVGTQAFKWANISDKKSHIYGALAGLLYQTPIEILDGFATDYGASWADMAANTFGSGLWIGQYLLWKEERVHLKYSFHRTQYAPQRPNVLGNGWTQEWLKDYNGQTYWLSFDVWALTGKKKLIPKWLNITTGFGAKGMISANEPSNNDLGLFSQRQFYFGLDLDLSHIKTKNKLLNTIIFLADMIKIPAPTFEYNKKGWKFHALYF